MPHKIRNNSGVALFIALMLVLMLSVIGIGIIRSSNDEITIAGNELQEMVAFYSAEAGLAQASAAIQTHYEVNQLAPTDLPAGKKAMANATMVYVTTNDGAAVAKKLTTGSLSGLNATVKSFTIESIGTSLSEGSQVRLTQGFEAAQVPIFQFAVFYMGDLWAQPAFDMNIDGRVHVNGDMYLRHSGSSSMALSFTDRVTCGGDINHGFGYGDDNHAADVKFRDGSGNMVSMKVDGNWLDASDSDWFTKASTTWGGRVRDQAFGEQSLNLPLTSDDPHKIIERANGSSNPDSYENKATLKIIDGVPYSKSGSSWINISGSLPSGTIIDGNADPAVEFYDAHEKKWVRNTQVDVGLLKSSGYYPSNGVIYVSDQRTSYLPDHSSKPLNGLSMVNGDQIDSPSGKGLTLASENPVYFQGDFNTNNKEPVAAICDAVTFLSNNWDPNDSDKAYYKRPASATTANISFITGNLPAEGTNYGGGLENLPRFLEDWNAKDFNLKGSFIQGWESRQAKGTWRYIQSSDAYYSAPTRNWSFDTDLLDPTKLPPETPQIQVFQRTGWQQLDAGITAADMIGTDSITN
ncbi:MAG: hypothetical protein GY841_03980 [FCB group bacterium]|nr:hypothetical protein [FCB group bacterium]